MMTTDSRWLAIDLGLSTGWATRLSDKRGVIEIYHGCEKFHHASRFEGAGMRFLKFTRWLEQMRVNLGTIDWICFEEVRAHKGTDAAHAYGGFLSHLQAWCELNSIPHMGIPVGVIKKFATGKGNAGKPEMIAAMVKRGHQLTAKDDDQADALTMIHWMTEYATTNPDRGGPSSDRTRRRRVTLVEG